MQQNHFRKNQGINIFVKNENWKLVNIFQIISIYFETKENYQNREVLKNHKIGNFEIKSLNIRFVIKYYRISYFLLQQIQWFWRALRSFDQAERAKLLQFVTGTSKVPLQGFGALEGMNGTQKFQIHRDDRSTDRLPSAHTW